MASSEWQELEKLKEDFRKAQESTTMQKLSERNCIELVLKLQEMDIIKLLHTMDGKEYITFNQLGTEIQNELYSQQGRISIADLQVALKVNYSHIELKVNELATSNKSLHLVMGELVESSYLDRVAEEVNDMLQSAGQITISDLCKFYNLPGEFLIPELKSRLGTFIKGKMDSGNNDAIFTDSYVDRHRAYIRGRFSGITRPTQLKTMLNESQIPSKLFYSIANELIREKRIRGNLIGANTENSTFIPNAYIKLQNNWIKSFFSQNSYIEFDAIKRIGIDNAVAYVKENFKDVVLLNSIAIHDSVIDQIAANIEENVSGKNWLDIMQVIPIPVSEKDGSQLLNLVLSSNFKHQSKGMLIKDTMFASKELVDSSLSLFDDFLKERATKDAKTKASSITEDEMKRLTNPAFMYETKTKLEKKDERRKKTNEGSGSTTSGGGAGIGAREVKTKGKDKKRLKRMKELEDKQRDQEEKSMQMEQINEFFTIEEVKDVLHRKHSEVPHELIEEIATHHYQALHDKCVEMSKSVFHTLVSNKKEGESGASNAPQKVKSRKEFESEINTLWSNITMYAAGVKQFEGLEIESVLQRHLLSTLCLDLVNALFNMMAIDVYLNVENNSDVTEELRLNIISKLSNKLKQDLIRINTLVGGKNLEAFISAFEDVVKEDKCEVMLKKIDKKSNRQMIHSNKINLLNQLSEGRDLATVLHVATLLAFQIAIGQIVHAPGKCVPAIISFLRPHLNKDAFEALLQGQDLVMKKILLEAKDSTEEELLPIIESSKACILKLQDLPQNIKKSAAR